MKLVWISDNPYVVAIGQSRVTREVCMRLCKHFDLTVLGFAEESAEERRSVPQLPFGVHVITRGDWDSMARWILSIDPDYIVMSHDARQFAGLVGLKGQYPGLHAQWIGYFTIDSMSLAEAYRPIVLGLCDALISPTRWGRDVLLSHWPELGDVDVAPYGCGMHRVDEVRLPALREEAMQALGVMGFKQEHYSFIAMSAGMNIARKNWGCIFSAWHEFSKERKDVALLGFTRGKLKDRVTGQFVGGDYDMRHIGNANPSVFITEGTIGESTLQGFYNVADCFLAPTCAEGFGLAILEAMACGCVPIVTGATGQTEFCSQSNSVLLDSVPLDLGSMSGTWHVVDAKDLYRGLCEIYCDRQMLEEKRECGIRTAQEYTWDKTAKGILATIASLESGERKLRLLAL